MSWLLAGAAPGWRRVWFGLGARSRALSTPRGAREDEPAQPAQPARPAPPQQDALEFVSTGAAAPRKSQLYASREEAENARVVEMMSQLQVGSREVDDVAFVSQDALDLGNLIRERFVRNLPAADGVNSVTGRIKRDELRAAFEGAGDVAAALGAAGLRPEDASIVARHFGKAELEKVVLPGDSSGGRRR
jgi:hypothetical protein